MWQPVVKPKTPMADMKKNTPKVATITLRKAHKLPKRVHVDNHVQKLANKVSVVWELNC